MSAEIRERAFEPFFTTKPAGQGTGMGLPAVHGFVLQSGGDMRLESECGRGTVVTLYLKASAPGGRAAGSAEVVPDMDRAPVGRILAVEDDPLLRESVAEQIVTLGYAVDIVGDVASALRKLEEGRRYDLVFSDIVMPGGLSGFDLARTVRERWPGLPVLLTTGYSDEERLSGGRPGPEFPVLRKPYTLPILATRLREAISG
jgi:CheY-like chemotaxis protein